MPASHDLGTAVLWAVWPFVAVQNENGQVVDDIQVRPGATVPVPAGTRFDTIKAQVDLNVLQAMFRQPEYRRTTNRFS